MLRLEIIKSPDLKAQIKDPILVTKGLLEALFNIEQSDPKCKSEKSRSKAIKLLEVIQENFPQTDSTLLKYLCVLHTSGNWRTNKKGDWNIRPGLDNRAGNFVGLKNLGATCYMNSSLQQFFMIPQFRNGVVEVDHHDKKNEETVLFQLQLIFASLIGSQRAVYNPKSLTQVFKIDGRILNVLEQKDVDEFITNLLDHVEQELKNTPQSKLVKNTFKLTLANEIICKDCPHMSETDEDAISIILSVKNKKNIYEGLNAFVQSDTLEGENAYYCERCDKKVSAYKRQNVKTLPNVLIIVLKRFEFNVETMARIKVNDYCEFPHDLDLEEFTQEGQTCKDLNHDLESGKLTHVDLTEEQRKLLLRKVPKDYYKYKLKGVTVHSGNADSGHYYSYIMDREKPDLPEEKRWLEFNDTFVRPFDPKDIPDETFGGEEESYYSPWGKKELSKEKLRNAYVLFYERVVQIDADLLAKYKEEEREIDPGEVGKRFEQMRVEKAQTEMKIPEALQRFIQMDNKKFWLTQYIFHPNYLSFVCNTIGKYKVVEDNNYVLGRESISLQTSLEANIEATQFAAIFLLTTALRAENKDAVPGLLNNIKAHCEKDVKLCLWLCNLFSYPEIIQEFLTECPLDNVRRWVAGLLYIAMKHLYPLERSAIHKLVIKQDLTMHTAAFKKEVELPEATISVGNKVQILGEKHKIPYLMLMINAFVQQISNVSEHNFGQFFQVFCYFAQLGPETRKYLNVFSMIGVAVELLLSTKGKCTNLAEKVMLHIELKSAVPIGVMTKEHVYISKKAILTKKPLQHIFLFELVYRLVTSAEIPKLKKLPSREDEAMKSKFNDSEEQHILSFFNAKILDTLLLSCQESKVSLTYLSKILAYLTFDHGENSGTMIKYLINKIQTVECDKLWLYFRIAYFFLANLDKYPDKIQTFLKCLYECFKKGVSFFRVAESMIDFIIKISRENEVVLSYLRDDKYPELGQLLDAMERWLKEYSYPSYFFPVNSIN